jgi:hypothetical protein
MKNWINAYPHPGPLPQERVRDYAPSVATLPFRVRRATGRALLCLSKTIQETFQGGGLFLPLLRERVGVRADQSSKASRRNAVHPLDFA